MLAAMWEGPTMDESRASSKYVPAAFDHRKGIHTFVLGGNNKTFPVGSLLIRPREIKSQNLRHNHSQNVNALFCKAQKKTFSR